MKSISRTGLGVLLVLAVSMQAWADSAAKPGGNSPHERWLVRAGRVLQDASSGLQWTQQDNAADIDWAGAQRYCEQLRQAGGRWRLPSVEELTGIYSSGRDGTTSCGSYADKTFTCNVSSLFRLSGPWFWSATPAAPQNDGSPRAVDVNLINGLQHLFGVDNKEYGRALCVRRP